jgi:hypothetical protein
VVTLKFSLYLIKHRLSIYGSTALCWTLAAFSVSWSSSQSVGLLGRGISPSQGRYLHTGQHKHRINADRYLCLKWDSNRRSNVRACEDSSCPRPRGHCDRQLSSTPWRNMGEWRYNSTIFTSELDWGVWSALSYVSLAPGKEYPVPIGGWVGPRDGLDAMVCRCPSTIEP